MRSLSPAGQAAAARLAVRLKDVAINAIYSSPYSRAIETVAPLAERLNLPVQELGDLRERKLGTPSGLSFEDAVAATFSDFAFSHPDGESSRRAQRRVLSVVETLVSRHPSGLLVLSTHGNLLTLLLNHYDRSLGFEFWQSLTFPDVYRIELLPSGGNSVEHLCEPAS
jgi:2,3-bisphosphoglycerate-dependent phosphoglycerate mutase